MIFYVIPCVFRLKEEDPKIKERRYHLRPVEVACSHNVKMETVGFEREAGEMELVLISLSLQTH